MTAGHETHEMYDGTDALMAAITGEELPEEARADAALAAEHRRATADVALLRQQLGIIGDALAEEPRPERTPAPVRASRDRRRVRRFAFGSLAVATVAAVLSGVGWLVVQAGSGAGSMPGGSADSASKGERNAEAGSAFSSPGYLACARLVAEGEVTGVEPVPGTAGQERITVDVTRSYKPQKSTKELSVVIDEGALLKALHKGDHVLVAVPQHAATPDHVLVGEKSIARERAGLGRALKESAGIGC
ncbi:hypothetical protein [Streptomyces guryensis]|uniref:Uncharacterized protein n=1 Tax=Streptomyces guryensis TaxID=2886947 RepID=A0A9Q3Z7H9_9ACTN|nr:hypothetical protein [Streptomyces guryensis]MCD9872310.1 hypothetical protein [Streptomyces guryensis]